MSGAPHPFSVLYVDDVHALRVIYRRFLGRRFQRVFVAADGEEALRIFGRERPDIVISDIVMPRIDGLELLRRIRESSERTRTILLTAYSDKEKLLRATELDLTKYLIKPVRKRTFLEALEKAVEQLYRRERTLRRYANGYAFDARRGLLLHKGRTVELTKNERLLVTLLAEAEEEYCSIERLEHGFYLKFGRELTRNALKLTIARLRRKLPEPLVENLFGYGYRLMPEE